MSKTTARRLAFVVAGLVLLVTPLVVRSAILGYNRRPYAPADVPSLSVAATPAPTAVPLPQPTSLASAGHELRPGPVVVDLAHGNRVQRNQFEPLAAALASHGLGMRFWLGDVDPMTVSSFLDYPDQSEELASLLRDASGLVVVSPFFLWSKAEIALAEQFVADGGRLLLISDPDVVGDLAQDINNLGEPFGIVFADDYLYDTVENDENYVHVFPSEFVDDAAGLAGNRIAFYGTRSISGEVTPQALTSDTTLSNLRKGLTGLSTLIKAGLDSRGTQGGVMAMGDFDVLTAPFVERHDNAQLTEYVAEFLASGERTQDVTDFPAYLGKDVTLVLANADAVDSKILEEGSRLQQSLEASGRTLSVAGTGLLTGTLNGAAAVQTDLIVLADYALADAETTLLDDLGYALVEATPTPGPTRTQAATPETVTGETPPIETPSPTATPAPTGTPSPDGVGPADGEPQATATARAAPANSRRGYFRMPGEQDQVGETPEALQTPTATFTPVPVATSTPTPTPSPSPTPSPTTTPLPEVYLEAQDGLRLVAADTVLIAQRELEDGRRMLMVLGYNNEDIRSGIDRLLARAFEGCVTTPDLAVCSAPNGGAGAANGAAPSTAAQETPEVETTQTPSAVEPGKKLVMVIDDNDLTLPGETSEADIYLKALTQQGYGPTLWLTASDGIPKLDDLAGYHWVIWSSGGYESGGPGLADLDPLLAFINTGGSLTISSRRPFFGMSAKEPSVIVDVAVDDDLPSMVQGLPSTAIRLENGLPPVIPLEISEDHAGAQIVLVRGPESSDAGAPLLFVVLDDSGEEATGARLMIAGMSLTWLPEDYRLQLVRNMSVYMTGN